MHDDRSDETPPSVRRLSRPSAAVRCRRRVPRISRQYPRAGGALRRRRGFRQVRDNEHNRTGPRITASSRWLTRTSCRLPIKTFLALVECNRGTGADVRNPDHINAVEIAPLPIRNDRGIATVICYQKAGQLRDVDVLPWATTEEERSGNPGIRVSA